MVACHRKLRHLFLDEEIVELLLLGELITETDTVVIDAETDKDLAVVRRLRQGRRILVVLVADVLGLSPYGLPGLIEGRGLFLGEREAFHQVGFLQTFRGVLVFGQDKSQVRGLHNLATLVGHLIDRTALPIHRELQLDIAIR